MPNGEDEPARHDGPDEIEALRAFVAAHAVPNARDGTRDPIWYLPFHGDLMHHALPDDPTLRPRVDEALLEGMSIKGLISIDYSDRTWKITPTPKGRTVVEEHERTLTRPAVDEGAMADVVLVVERQSRAPNPLAWPAVRPVLEGLRAYWQAAGYPHYGIPLIPIASALPDDRGPLFAATIRALTDSNYLTRGRLGGVFKDDDGQEREFPAEVALTEKAHAILDGWPGAAPNELVENMLAVLLAAAADEPDPTRRRRLETLAQAIKDLGIAVTSEVIAKVVTGGSL